MIYNQRIRKKRKSEFPTFILRTDKMENNTEKLLHYLYECSEEGVIPKIHSEDLMNLDFLKPFIKWLVDNDKIDLDNLIIKKVEDRGGNKVIKDIKYYSDYESLLMILSISDTPIEDLISYLKIS